MASVVHDSRCKCCNSAFKERIHSLALQGFNPQQIYNYLQNITDQNERLIVQREDIKPSSIRRHLDNHFDRSAEEKIKTAEVEDRLEISRNNLQSGIQITIDKVNSISHLIDSSLIKMEKLDKDANIKGKDKYSLSIQYANSIKGLIESLNKLTSEMGEEATLDANFFNTEISIFADIVLATIRSCDNILGLEGQLEQIFAQEFRVQYGQYHAQQVQQINGEVPLRTTKKNAAASHSASANDFNSAGSKKI